jgi:hypothetical protein
MVEMDPKKGGDDDDSRLLLSLVMESTGAMLASVLLSLWVFLGCDCGSPCCLDWRCC